MLITVTHSISKHKFAIAAHLILIVERDNANPVETRMITSMTNGKGNIAYPIMETPEEVADMLARLAGKQLVESKPAMALVS